MIILTRFFFFKITLSLFYKNTTYNSFASNVPLPHSLNSLTAAAYSITCIHFSPMLYITVHIAIIIVCLYTHSYRTIRLLQFLWTAIRTEASFLFTFLCPLNQRRTQEFFFGGGGSTNSVEDRGQTERGSGGGIPLLRGSGGSCNLVQEISFHIVKFS